MKKIFLSVLMLTIFFATQCEAVFESFKTSDSRLLIAEIAGYGIYELKPEFMANFYDVVRENLQSNFNIESRNNFSDTDSAEDKIFSAIHMNAIANGRLYRRETANAQMVRYADNLRGKDYYMDENKTESRRKLEGTPYNLTPDIAEEVIELGEKYNVDYMLFCNIRDADVWRKTGGIFGASPSSYDLRGKRVQVEMEYYLINVKTGKVFEGQNSDKRTSLTTNILIGKYGDNYTVADMINYVLNDQAAKLSKKIIRDGLKAVKS